MLDGRGFVHEGEKTDSPWAGEREGSIGTRSSCSYNLSEPCVFWSSPTLRNFGRARGIESGRRKNLRAFASKYHISYTVSNRVKSNPYASLIVPDIPSLRSHTRACLHNSPNCSSYLLISATFSALELFSSNLRSTHSSTNFFASSNPITLCPKHSTCALFDSTALSTL